jgi:hypothetical protein
MKSIIMQLNAKYINFLIIRSGSGSASKLKVGSGAALKRCQFVTQKTAMGFRGYLFQLNLNEVHCLVLHSIFQRFNLHGKSQFSTLARTKIGTMSHHMKDPSSTHLHDHDKKT